MKGVINSEIIETKILNLFKWFFNKFFATKSKNTHLCSQLTCHKSKNPTYEGLITHTGVIPIASEWICIYTCEHIWVLK